MNGINACLGEGYRCAGFVVVRGGSGGRQVMSEALSIADLSTDVDGSTS
jgi:hypothetical protein